MVDTGQYNSYSSRTAGQAENAIKSVQSWKTSSYNKPSLSKQAVITQLEKASEGRVGSFDLELRTASAYADSGRNIPPTEQNKGEYKFEDVIDVINPLHHLPIVGMAYRKLTGDTIHPMSQIIGGALYGGPIGAVTGTINAVSQAQTGQDISDHALSLVGIGTSNNVVQKTNFNNSAMSQQTNTLSFANVAAENTMNNQFKALKIASNAYQSASSLSTETDLDNLPHRDKITSMSLSAMPQEL